MSVGFSGEVHISSWMLRRIREMGKLGLKDARVAAWATRAEAELRSVAARLPPAVQLDLFGSGSEPEPEASEVAKILP